ncbi:MAG: hypothetical protein ACXAEL_16320 [Candidatus Hodarchaeales archaeon]
MSTAPYWALVYEHTLQAAFPLNLRFNDEKEVQRKKRKEQRSYAHTQCVQ